MRAEALGARLQAMLGAGVDVGWAEVTGTEGLFPAEAAAVARAVPKRRAEFAAGRRAARIALAAIGAGATEIAMGPHRAPIWPRGVSGAITHDGGVALAAVMPETAGTIGVDLTEAAPLPSETRLTILPHPEERGLGDLAARMGFSAKECLFKALFPSLETYFGFEAAVFTPGPALETFTLHLVTPLGSFPAGARWQGAATILGKDVLTVLLVPSGDTTS